MLKILLVGYFAFFGYNHVHCEEKFFNSLFLNKDKTFRLSWKFDDQNVTFEIKAKSKGWVGLGFSPNGAMTGSDIVVAWVDGNGIAQISDRYGKQNGFPPVDAHQDYSLLKGTKDDQGLSFTFTRKRNTCDKQDNELLTDATRLIFAFDDVVPKSENVFTKHAFDHRGSKTVYLFDPPREDKPLPKDVVTLDFLAKNVSVPDDFDTLYWCEVIEMPDLKVPHHMIRYEPIIQEGNEPFVHHMILSQCMKDMSQYVGKGSPCFDRTETNFSHVYEECSSNIIFGWAVGGESGSSPDDVGTMMFGGQTTRFFLLETHYDNSNYQKNVKDHSGVKLFLTPTLRKYSSANAFFATPVGPEYQIIPPGQESFTTYAYCSAECTNSIPKDGLTVLSAMVHQHKAGIKGRLKHIRNGIMLEDIIADEHYDFNYQNSRPISRNVKIMPGDELVVECVYNTKDRKDITFGGFSTKKEMCEIYVETYPLVRGFYCISAPVPRDTWKIFGANFFPDEFSTMIRMPEGRNMTQREFALNQMKFDTPNKAQAYQTLVRDSTHFILCGMAEDKQEEKIDVDSSKNKTFELYDISDIKLQNGYPKFKSSQVSKKKNECKTE